MPISLADKRATFRKLHESGCFSIPNPFDIGSAKALAQMGFKALASTSAGMAWSLGRPDGAVALDVPLSRMQVPVRVGGPLFSAAAQHLTAHEALRALP